MKPPVSRKLAVRHTKLVCLTASFLATGGFKFQLFQNVCMVYKHAYLKAYLLLHSTFMLSVVKMLVKGEVGGHALNSHGNYIVDHGKSWKNHGIAFLNFCGNPAYVSKSQFSCYYPYTLEISDRDPDAETGTSRSWIIISCR